MGYLPDINPLTLWRLLDAKWQLANNGVEIANVNGLMNEISWARSLGGHFIKHDEVPDDWDRTHKIRLMIPTNAILDIRTEVAYSIDRHSVESANGEWFEIRKLNDSLFVEDRMQPLYVGHRTPQCRLPLFYLTERRRWCCFVEYPDTYEYWKIMETWFPKIVDCIEREELSIPPGVIELNVRFQGAVDGLQPDKLPSQLEIEQRMSVQFNRTRNSVTVETDEAFEQGLRSPRNISEAAIVGTIVKAVLELTGQHSQEMVDRLRKAIVSNESARSYHAFQARNSREILRDDLPATPIMLNAFDDATLRVGIGWKACESHSENRIEGKMECTRFLNSLVKTLEDEVCTEIRKFRRLEVVVAALRNYESAMAYQSVWRRTAGANLALRENVPETLAAIGEQEYKNNVSLLISRIIAEIANCECEEGATGFGELDFSCLMAKLLWATTLGGWSDAIHFGAIEPIIWITALGDVRIDTSLYRNVVLPFGEVVHEHQVNIAIASYARNFERPPAFAIAEPEFESEFIDAWCNEHQYGIDELRHFRDAIVDLAESRNELVMALRMSELLRSIDCSPVPNVQAILRSLTYKPRKGWHDIPPGYSDRDRQPWRLRRRLSVLRRPIVQIDEDNDPLVVIASGLLPDSVSYIVSGYYNGVFSHSQIKSPQMKAWAGQVAHRQGTEFSEAVARRLSELGWKVESQVNVTKIVKKGFATNFGDVDVLAWNDITGRVLLVECKDLQFKRTVGEIAEQLGDFRGETRFNKRDLLRRHLDRSEVLSANVTAIADYLGMAEVESLESWIVFKNPVPMLFAWREFSDRIKITTYDQLDTV